ncbi:oligosaccharide flippase family protein [Bradyrhizobium sp. NBAIM20]|uniref:oligosaccharide flippase family protein n=1 Tax=unclassified Bradyrhizobium TaxID=2631580 RepID=UPI001CD1CACD|nr:oligosaccharide flippase family protein [Bradyrhizobium sp. NBAIM20]MCA1461857.1 oligosaccharide flippase family protein [Bradyrhizobium sp. NBAIM18]
MSLHPRKALASVSWSFLEGTSLAALSFATLVIVTRRVTPTEMGAFAVGLAFIEIATTAVTMFFHDAVIRKAELSERDLDTAFTTTVVTGLVMALIIAGSAPFLSLLFENDLTCYVLVALSPCVLISSLGAVTVADNKRHLEFKSLAVRSILGRVLGALIAIALAFAGGGLWSLVAQQFVMVSVSTFVLLWRATRKPKLLFDQVLFRELIVFAAQSMTVLLLNFSLRRIFIMVVGVLLGVAQAGYINVAFRTIDTLWSLSAGALQQVALPVLSRTHEDLVTFRRHFATFMYLASLALYPLFAGLAYFSEESISLLFGEAWLPSSIYVVYLGTLVLLQVPRMVLSTTLIAAGFPGDQIVSSIAQFVLLAVAILVFGVERPLDAVLIWISVEAIQVPILSRCLKLRTQISFAGQIRPLARPLLACAVMTVGLFVLTPFLRPNVHLASFILAVAAGGCIYVLCAAALDLKSCRLVFKHVRSRFDV